MNYSYNSVVFYVSIMQKNQALELSVHSLWHQLADSPLDVGMLSNGIWSMSQPIKKQYMELFLQIHQGWRLCSFNKQAVPSPRLATGCHPTPECPTCPLHMVNAESFTWHQCPHFELATWLITLELHPAGHVQYFVLRIGFFSSDPNVIYLFLYIIYINFSLYHFQHSL